MWPFESPAWYLCPKSVFDDDSLTKEELRENRKQACEFITKVARRLNLTIATAQLYFHLFFTKYSMKIYPHMVSNLFLIDSKVTQDIALTALLVASKAEETYKKIRQILSAAFLILNPQFDGSELDIVEEHRQRVTQYEHLMLEAIDYNFSIRHAHEVLAILSRIIEISEKGASHAFDFIVKCYQTPLILCYPPELIALAALFDNKNAADEQKLARKLGIRISDIVELLDHVKRNQMAKT